MSKVDVTMPQMGESVTEGTIIKWLKKEGEEIEQDEMLLEISTDKVDSEIPSPETGIVKKILVQEGETVEVGDNIAQIETDEAEAADDEQNEKEEKKAKTKEGETEEKETKTKKDKKSGEEKDTEKKGGKERPADEQSKTKAKQKEKADKKESEKKQETETKVKEDKEKEPEVEESEADEGEKAEDEPQEKTAPEKAAKAYSPLVRNIAREENVSLEELESIKGSGANGRVTKQDILDYVKNRTKEDEKTERKDREVEAVEPEFVNERTEVIPMGTMRSSIAEHMVRSVQTSPHVFTVSHVDMTNLVRYRTASKERFQEKTGTKLTYMPFIIRACTKALRDFPLVNSSVDGNKIIRKKYINIGVAVALENNGLIVPVIENADNLSIVGLAKAVNDLATRARSKKLKPDEVKDGTFSITNMGSFGSVIGLPIINQPQVAILGVGIIEKRPVVIEDAIAIRNMMYISLSFDHRIVDGALAGRFLDRIAEYLTSFDAENVL